MVLLPLAIVPLPLFVSGDKLTNRVAVDAMLAIEISLTVGCLRRKNHYTFV